VRSYVDNEEIFLANYADTLTDAPLDEHIARFRTSNAVATMLAVPPVSTHHVLEFDSAGQVAAVRQARDLMQWENGGYFVLRPQIFDVLREGEEMVPHAFARLLDTGRLTAFRYTGFWRAADTFKDRVELEEMFRRGQCPWMLWNRDRRATTRIPAANGSQSSSGGHWAAPQLTPMAQ
jgi:glucose-1-phosphate cytidylyltransferase